MKSILPLQDSDITSMLDMLITKGNRIDLNTMEVDGESRLELSAADLSINMT